MNIFKNPFRIFESENPAVRKQKAYKNLAKRRGLLSYNQFGQALKEGEEIRGAKISFESVNVTVTEAKSILEASKKSETLVLKDKVLFSPNNLNSHYIGAEDIKAMVDKFNQDGNSAAQDILNINHSQNIEDSLGSFQNVTYDEEANLIKGDVSIERFNNSRLQDMFNVLEESSEIQLGLSIEFTAEDYDWIDGQFAYKETTLVGLALTLTPSAPQTLTSLETKIETKEEKTPEVPKEEEKEKGEETLKALILEDLKVLNTEIENLKTGLEALKEELKKEMPNLKKQLEEASKSTINLLETAFGTLATQNQIQKNTTQALESLKLEGKTLSKNKII